MPILPEKLLSADDFSAFFDLWNRKFSKMFTENDLEAYKYVNLKNGRHNSLSLNLPKKYIFIVTFDSEILLMLGALSAGINYFRANSSFFNHPIRNQIDGSDGMFILGQKEPFISHAPCIVLSNDYPKLRVEVIPNANHFVQQDAPSATNTLIREFLSTM